MSETGFVLLLASSMYGLRISGMFLSRLSLPETWENAWRYLPIALLSALIVTGVNDGLSTNSWARVVGIGVAGVAFYFSRRMWVGISTGLISFWVIQSIWP